MNHSLIIVLAFLLLPITLCEAKTYTVRDKDHIAESIREHNEILAQWARSNQTALEQLKVQQRIESRQIEQGLTTHKDSWDSLISLNHSSLALLEAEISAYGEYAAFNNYLTSKIKRESWTECARRQNCSFRDQKKALYAKEIQQAETTARKAEQEREFLKLQQQMLLSYINEGHEVRNPADLLDTLLKVSTISAMSLTELNRQLNFLIGQQNSHKTAELAELGLDKKEERRFISPEELPSDEHFDLRIGKHVK